MNPFKHGQQIAHLRATGFQHLAAYELERALIALAHLPQSNRPHALEALRAGINS